MLTLLKGQITLSKAGQPTKQAITGKMENKTDLILNNY